MGEVFSSWVMIEEVVVQAVDAVVETCQASCSEQLLQVWVHSSDWRMFLWNSAVAGVVVVVVVAAVAVVVD